MRVFNRLVLAATVVIAFAANTSAQRPDGPPPDGPPRGERGPGDRGPRGDRGTVPGPRHAFEVDLVQWV